jgi:hypothetical protein
MVVSDWRGSPTLSTEEFARDVEGFASHNDDLLAIEELLRDCAGKTTEQVTLAVDDDLVKVVSVPYLNCGVSDGGDIQWARRSTSCSQITCRESKWECSASWARTWLLIEFRPGPEIDVNCCGKPALSRCVLAKTTPWHGRIKFPVPLSHPRDPLQFLEFSEDRKDGNLLTKSML